MTQHDMILDYMRENGSITTMEAFDKLCITKLTTRLSELRRMGYNIKQQKFTGKDRRGEIVTYNRYWLVEGDNATD